MHVYIRVYIYIYIYVKGPDSPPPLSSVKVSPPNPLWVWGVWAPFLPACELGSPLVDEESVAARPRAQRPASKNGDHIMGVGMGAVGPGARDIYTYGSGRHELVHLPIRNKLGMRGNK